MPTFQFRKLVRDRIIEHQIRSGAVPHHRQLKNAEYIQALIAKLSEEAAELLETTAENAAEELADVQQIVDDLREHLGITPEVLAAVQQGKIDKNGAFKNGDYVDYLELSEDDPWTAYYRQHPKRYPELRK
jgi:predicted house-cleaning noncanonical NTP pyrophosphatase (MazG superfamily)